MSLDAATAQHVSGDTVRPVLFVDLDYPEGPVRMCSLDREMELDGQVYLPGHGLGAVGTVQEGTDSKSYGVTLTLSGVPGQWSRYLAGQNVQGRRATIRLGFCTPAWQLLAPPVVIFVGRMDTQDIQASPDDTSVQVACESILIDWERPCSRRYTDVDQRARHPGDRGLEYVAATANAEFAWGR